MKKEQRILRDIENAYRITISDIKRYTRQAGTISIDVVKKFIRFNYFKNTNPVGLWTYEGEGGNYTIITTDMFELQLWILENYDIEAEKLDDIADDLRYFTTIGINLK